MKLIASLIWTLLLGALMFCAARNAKAQNVNACDNPKKLPASFFEVPTGPQGDWRATVATDVQQSEDPLVPVVVAGVGAIQGPADRRGMRLGCGVLKNRSPKSVASVALRWILVRNQDRPEIAKSGYSRETVLDQGITDLMELMIVEDSFRRTDFSIINFASITQRFKSDGKLSGDYFLCLGVHEVHFSDGSVWKAEPLVR